MQWVLACHIISMVAWFAGLFYLPRLFVYHANTEDSTSHKRFVIMERRLFWGIMLPAAILTTLFGLWLFLNNTAYYATQGWMHVKLLGVFLLYAYQCLCWYFMRAFRDEKNTRSNQFYRYFNEIPTVLLVVIVIMVVVRP